jgi:serine/threonine-protein kinase
MDARALQLLEQALTRPDAERADFVRDAAGADSRLLADTLALLQAHGDSAGLLESRQVPTHLGPWQLRERLGAGGMGEVYRVERWLEGTRQQGALKRIAPALAGPQALARFEAERRFLTRLAHPHIARILDAGRDGDGRPWVVMEYVDGAPIDQWCRLQSLDPVARVRLFLQVIEAVEAAHRALVLHRDLKPANILVGADGHVRLLDFGIARALDDDAGLTATGPGPLTPRYASPEQLAGLPLTTAADVYALGLVLHELLTGQLPAPHQGHSASQIDTELRRTAQSRPSASLDAEALTLDARQVELWRRRLRGDLDRVLLKALALDIDRRYPTAAAFGADLEHWLASRPVSARAGDRGYRLKLFLRRNRLPVAAGSAAVLALTVGLGIAAQQAMIARAEAERVQRSNAFLLSMIADANPVAAGGELSLIDAIDQAVGRVQSHFADQPEEEARIRTGIAHAYTNLMQLDAAEAQLRQAVAVAPAGSRARPDALRARGLLAWTRGRTDAALPDFLAAREQFARLGLAREAGIVDNDLAQLMLDLGRAAEAVPYAERTVASARALGLPAASLGTRLDTLGGALHLSGDLDGADRVYREAIAVLASALPRSAINHGVALNNHGLVLRDQRRPTEALARFTEAIAAREAALGADDAGLAGPLANAATLQAELGQLAEAAASIDRALALAERAYAPDYVGRARVHLAAAEVALARGDATDATRHADAALAVYAKADSPDARGVERARTALARAAALKPPAR